MAPIPPGRAALRTAPLVLVVSLGLGGLLASQGDLRPAVAATVVTAAAMAVVIGQAPARLAWRLQEFAGQVPGEPDAAIAGHGEQTLEWPDLGLTVEGNVHRYRLQDFGVQVGPTHRYLSAGRPREAARTALDELGEPPALTDPSDRLPSCYPRLAGLKFGFLVAVLAGMAIGLGGPILARGVYPLWWWALAPLVGGLAGSLRWLGLVHVRRAVRSLAAALQYGGVELERIDRTAGWLRLEFTAHTTVGDVPIRCIAVPYGPMTAAHPTDPDETVSTRLPDPMPIAERTGGWRR